MSLLLALLMAPPRSLTRKQIKTKLMLYKPLFTVHVKVNGLFKLILHAKTKHLSYKSKQQGSHWQQFDTTPILISAPQWLHRPCNVPKWFYWVGKKSSVKADFAIYSHILDISGWCMSVSLISFIKLDFSFFAN